MSIPFAPHRARTMEAAFHLVNSAQQCQPLKYAPRHVHALPDAFTHCDDNTSDASSHKHLARTLQFDCFVAKNTHQDFNLCVSACCRFELHLLMTTVLGTAPHRGNGFHSPGFYVRSMVGGAMAGSMAHAAVVTLDVAKCRSQAHSVSGAWPSGLMSSVLRSVQLEGVAGVTRGIAPAYFGYFVHGFCKFGCHHFFTDLFTNVVGTDTVTNNHSSRVAVWTAASGAAEVVSSIVLCPFEMAKVKMQVALPGSAEAAELSAGMIGVMRSMNSNKVNTLFPFGSFGPLLARQVPYTMIKFFTVYNLQSMTYAHILATQGKRSWDCTEGEQLAIAFGCGYMAGVVCPIITQPMDNLVSMRGNHAYDGMGWKQMASEMGIVNLFTKGLLPRIIMAGTITGLQWWIYGNWKLYCRGGR